MRFAKPIAIVTLTLACLGGCSKSTDPATADYWIDRLDDRQERVEALTNLGRIGDRKAVPRVLKWFKREGVWQSEAAYSLGQLGDTSVIPDLVSAIDYSVGTPRDNVTRQRSRLNISIVKALALLKAKDQAEAITKLLAKGDDRVKEACLVALADLGDFKNTDVITKSALNDSDPFVRLAAIRALGELGDPKAVPALIEMLFVELPNASFYEPARYALIQVGQPAVPDLLRTLKRENQAVEKIDFGGKKAADGAIEAKAAAVLGSLRAPEAAEAVAAAITALYPKARKAESIEPPPAYFAVIELAYALSNIGGSKAAAALLPIAKDTDPGLRLAACESLTGVGDRSTVAGLIAAARVGPPEARRAALVAASRMGSATDIAAFDALAKGDKKSAQEVPDEIMANMVTAERSRLVAAQTCASDANCWKGKIADPDSRIRERAAYELGWLRAKGVAPELLKAAEDDDAQVRMAAVLSIGNIAGTNGIQADKLQAIYDKWHNKPEYGGVSQELWRVIARTRSLQKSRTN